MYSMLNEGTSALSGTESMDHGHVTIHVLKDYLTVLVWLKNQAYQNFEANVFDNISDLSTWPMKS
jgi:hypothetical protein